MPGKPGVEPKPAARKSGGFFVAVSAIILPDFTHFITLYAIRLIVGLGNPGPEYEQTRHNAGFWLVDNLANSCPAAAAARIALQCDGRQDLDRRPRSLAARAADLHEPLRPVGRRAGALLQDQPEEVLVVHDELDLMPGVAKLKRGGSSGGHNGLKDITAALGTQDYWRLRLGIGHPRTLNLQQGVADFVLHRPRREEQSPDRGIDRQGAAHHSDGCEGKMAAATTQLHTD
jgi:PTH1 family peptidyl-tRNA hydrolase